MDPRSSPFNHVVGELEKPVDIGNGVVSASVSRVGDLLSVGTAHSRCGFVELTALPAFDESRRRHPDTVRRYREVMTEDGFWVVAVEVAPGPVRRVETTLVDAAFPLQLRVHDDVTHEIRTWAPGGEPAIRQRHTFRAGEAKTFAVTVRCRGRVDRPALGEITETDPLPPTGARTRIRRSGTGLAFEAAMLPAYATLFVDTSAPTAPWEVDERHAALRIEWNPVRALDVLVVDVTCRLSESRPMAVTPSRSFHKDDFELERTRRGAIFAPRPLKGVRVRQLPVPDDLAPRLDWLSLRSLAYVHGCAAVTVAPGEICLMTDHRLLPLSWTRDAYYQALLLLADGSASSLQLVDSHLRWLWTTCERPDGRWVRSYLGSGAPKDRGVQADQQLYPLLELCDYRRTTGALPSLDHAGDWNALVRDVWAALPVHHETGLLASEENPADDPSDLPYLLSTQILWWLTITRLLELKAATGIPQGIDLESEPGSVRARIEDHFCTPGRWGTQWAYATDGRGVARLYNDANDLPTALAPLFGYCAADDAVWQATMHFTFSPENPGYSPGPRGGLGSHHTPGTWPLGDLQEWVAFGHIGNHQRATRALRRLINAATADGMLPEAYDSISGRVVARHWFAWPGAALAALHLGAFG